MDFKYINLPLMLVCLVALIVFQFSSVLCAQSEKAPSWEGTEWINLRPEEKS